MPHLRLFREVPEDGDTGEAGQPIHFVASSRQDVVRDDFEVNQDRWYLDNFNRNPVFLWAHDYWSRGPIGRVDAEVTDRGLEIDVTFDQADEFAREIERKYRDGFMNAVSTGWDDIKIDDEVWHDLWEVSAAPVPSDVNALMDRQRRALGRLGKELINMSDGKRRGSTVESWEEVAAAMVEVLDPGSEAGDRERKRSYIKLLPKYRELKKEPPEFLKLSELRALTAKDLEQIFLEDELEVTGMRMTRAGAVLAKRNKDRLRQASDLILEVLSDAEGGDEGDEDGDESDEDNARGADWLSQLHRTALADRGEEDDGEDED